MDFLSFKTNTSESKHSVYYSDVLINRNRYRESVESVLLGVSDRSKMLEISNPIQIILQ